MWARVNTPPTFSALEAHVWRFQLDTVSGVNVLSPDEQARADRLKIPIVRQRFISARVQMRQVLSLYAGLPPHELSFLYQESGKPFLPFSFDFNLTHTENTALLAVSYAAVGIDIERVRPVEGLDYIANSAFTALEREAINATPDKQLAFFRCWTRKEAYMKARGDGFKIATTFSVSVDDHPRLLEDSHWSFVEIRPESDVIAALCMRGKINKISYLQTENKF